MPTSPATPRAALAAATLLTCWLPARAQWNTPSIDGIIQAGELGNNNQLATVAAK